MGFSYTDEVNTRHHVVNSEITRLHLVKALDIDDATKEYIWVSIMGMSLSIVILLMSVRIICYS